MYRKRNKKERVNVCDGKHAIEKVWYKGEHQVFTIHSSDACWWELVGFSMPPSSVKDCTGEVKLEEVRRYGYADLFTWVDYVDR